MIKEIFDEPQTARQALDVPQEQIKQLAEMFQNAPQCLPDGGWNDFFHLPNGSIPFQFTLQKYFPAISSDEFNGVVPVSSGELVRRFLNPGRLLIPSFHSTLHMKWAPRRQPL